MKISKQVFFQGLQQLFCIPYLYLSHGFKLPPSNQPSKISYQLPFKGEWTVVNGGCEKELSHSWGIPTQRYAYDFLRMDDNGKTYQGDQAELTSYACYDQNVCAPADGIVVAIGNDCEDEKPFVDEMAQAMAKDIRGNYLLIKHTDKEYGFIGHLKPQSILVEIGQRVRQGEIIARCGNSGNTSEPHIHFHLQDGIGFFTSAGIPIAFHNITIASQPGYEHYDKRTVALQNSASPAIQIGRGQQVKNTSAIL